MSVLGLTHKQPRVFAHDAIALKDLPGCIYRGITGINQIAANGGEGFVAGEQYSAVSTGYAGTIIQVEVAAVGPNGEILNVTVLNTDCQSTNLSKGDFLTVIWQPKGAQITTTPHVDAVNYIEIDGLQNTAWDYGCPITPLGTRFDGDPMNVNVPTSYRPTYSYRQKDLIKYRCNEEEGCEYEAIAPGAALYIGYALDTLTVITEAGKKATYSNIPAGTFMPILVLSVCGATTTVGDEPPTSETLKSQILALF